jgi:NitT/TauT family transport system substrate-binding protein
MYADPAALDIYADFAKVPASVAKRVRDGLIPKGDLDPDRLGGVDGAMADAVASKFLAAPLTDAQIRDLLQIPFK